MATMKFVKVDGTGTMRFDSSAQESICREYNYARDTFSLKNKRNRGSTTVRDVMAVPIGGSGDPYKVGELTYAAPLWPGGGSRPF